MANMRLRFVNEFIRRGKVYRYFRRPGYKAIRLPGLPGSAEFMEAYQAALDDTPQIEIGAKRSKPGTVAALVASYLGSTAFSNLAAESRRVRTNIMQRFREQHGEKRVALLQRRHVEAMVAAKAATPAAARNFLDMLRALMRHAMAIGMIETDPTQGVTRARRQSDGHHSWTEADIAAFESVHPVGTRARLALALLLYTGQRRSEVIRMGRQHITNGAMTVRQQKTGASLVIPMHPDLVQIIEATPSEHLTYLTTRFGTPFTTTGFSNWFREMCDAAGLQHCNAHGLRKAACRRLAEAGCSASEIMAISGHRSLAEAERYVRAVNQALMARAAMARIGNTELQTIPPKLTNKS